MGVLVMVFFFWNVLYLFCNLIFLKNGVVDFEVVGLNKFCWVILFDVVVFKFCVDLCFWVFGGCGLVGIVKIYVLLFRWFCWDWGFIFFDWIVWFFIFWIEGCFMND